MSGNAVTVRCGMLHSHEELEFQIKKKKKKGFSPEGEVTLS
jgi:hypothetical protein